MQHHSGSHGGSRALSMLQVYIAQFKKIKKIAKQETFIFQCREKRSLLFDFYSFQTKK